MQRQPPSLRPATPVLLALAAGLLLLAAEMACAMLCLSGRTTSLQRTARLVERLGLSDIALFTEARYTRHPSQADLFTPFQDAPLSLEHFPSGSLVMPPRHLRARQPEEVRP